MDYSTQKQFPSKSPTQKTKPIRGTEHNSPEGVTALGWSALCSNASTHERETQQRAAPYIAERPRPIEPLTARISVKPNLNPRRFVWSATIFQGKGSVSLYGEVDFNQRYARERAELDALSSILDWLKHTDAETACTILVSPNIYRLIFARTVLPKIDDVVCEVRQMHVGLRANVHIEPDQSQASIDATRKRASVHPFAPLPQLAPPEQPDPHGGLRRAA